MRIPDLRRAVRAGREYPVPLGTESGLRRRQPVCFSGGMSGWPVASSHTRAVRSSLAVSTRRPSGLKQAWRTAASCRSGPVTGCPLTADHTRAVPSSLAVTSERPSGLKATHHDFLAVSEGQGGLSPADDLPNSRRPVATGGDDAAAVRAKERARNQEVVPQRGRDGLAGGHLPDPGRVVVAGGDQVAAIGAERRVLHRVAVLQGRSNRPARCRLPHPRRAIVAARGDDTCRPG